METETAFFHSLANPKRRTMDNFFYASHIRHNFPCILIPISISCGQTGTNVFLVMTLDSRGHF